VPAGAPSARSWGAGTTAAAAGVSAPSAPRWGAAAGTTQPQATIGASRQAPRRPASPLPSSWKAGMDDSAPALVPSPMLSFHDDSRGACPDSSPASPGGAWLDHGTALPADALRFSATVPSSTSPGNVVDSAAGAETAAAADASRYSRRRDPSEARDTASRAGTGQNHCGEQAGDVCSVAHHDKYAVPAAAAAAVDAAVAAGAVSGAADGAADGPAAAAAAAAAADFCRYTCLRRPSVVVSMKCDNFLLR